MTDRVTDVLSDRDGNNYNAVIEFERYESQGENFVESFKVIEGAGKLEHDDVVYMAESEVRGRVYFDCDIDEELSKLTIKL